ncbi:MAG: hypothetical protein U0271_27840 [Polyangiaceae bacterium]
MKDLTVHLVVLGALLGGAALFSPRAALAGEQPMTVSGDAWQRPEEIYGFEIVRASLAFDAGFRFFGYNDGLSSNLRSYEILGAPGLAADVELFPFAPLGFMVLRDLGVTAEVRYQPGISSETTSGTALGTEWLRFGGGLRYRLPIDLGRDDKTPLVFGVRGGFHQDRFVIDSAPEVAGETPSVKYTFVSVGLDGRFPLGPVALFAYGDYLGATDSGEVHDRFRDPSIGGIDVGGGLAIPLVRGLELRVSAEYIRWFYAFGPVPGDSYVAGGALDEFVHLEGGLGYVY